MGDERFSRAPVRYRQVPGWPRYRVGTDRSVWVREKARQVAHRPRPLPVHRPSRNAGSANSRSLLTEELVAEARRLHAEGATPAELANRYGISPGGMWLALAGWNWSHVPMPPPPKRPGTRWRRLAPTADEVRLHHDGRLHTRSVELLYRAAFEPDTLTSATLLRIPPRTQGAPLGAIPPPARRPLPPLPPACDRPVLPAIAAAELPAVLPVDALAVAGESFPRSRALAEIPDDDDGNGLPARGSANGRARLDEAKVAEARRLHAEGWSYRALCERYGIGRVTLHYALVGKTWSHVPMAIPEKPGQE